jgi:Fic family protein
MNWNWQQSDWPHFHWDVSRLIAAEQQFLLRSGIYIGTVKHLEEEDRQSVTVDFLSSAAVTTSEIEGEILDRASVQSSIRHQLGLPTDCRRIPPAEQGIADVMVNLYDTYAAPLSHETLYRWHATLLNERRDIHDIGAYRTQDEPMQIISGVFEVPRVHFEAPPSSLVRKEMEVFVDWFNSTSPIGPNPVTALARAGAAHLYFESIHPFDDGNGRIGRAIAEKALAQSIGHPTLITLAPTILKKRKSYYQALESSSKHNEITRWLAWFAETALESLDRTINWIDFLIAKTALFDRLRGQLNSRQEEALLRMFREGPEGFKGGLSAANYMKIAETTSATTTRDLADLVEKGALRRVGERRHARYFLRTSEAVEQDTSAASGKAIPHGANGGG